MTCWINFTKNPEMSNSNLWFLPEVSSRSSYSESLCHLVMTGITVDLDFLTDISKWLAPFHSRLKQQKTSAMHLHGNSKIRRKPDYLAQSQIPKIPLDLLFLCAWRKEKTYVISSNICLRASKENFRKYFKSSFTCSIIKCFPLVRSLMTQWQMKETFEINSMERQAGNKHTDK